MINTVQDQGRPPAEEEGSTFTCEICIEPMLSSTKKFENNNSCVHPFCTDCMIKYIQVKVDDNVADVPCPALNCEQLLDPLSCRPIVPTNLFDKWCDVLCDSAVLGFERCYCPNRECSALIANECGGNVKKAWCPNCKRLFCFHCKISWHSGYRCRETRGMRDGVDAQFGALMQRRKWKRCPRCGHCIERMAGCDHIKCRCGTQFCFNCGIEMYGNFCRCDGVMMRRCCIWFCIWFLVIIGIVTLILCLALKVSIKQKDDVLFQVPEAGKVLGPEKV